MKQLIRVQQFLLLGASVLLLAGCGGKSGPDTPVGATKAFFKGFSEGDSKVVWKGLPESYQKDVNEVVQSFANKMDPELWDRSVGTLKKVAALLESKKGMVIELASEDKSKMDEKEAKVAVEGMIGIIDSLASDDFSNLENLKSFDGSKFPEAPIKKLFSQIAPLADLGMKKSKEKDKISLADLGRAKVALVKESGDKATVKITVPGEETKTSELVKVEGKWIPEEMNPTEWKKKIDEIKKGIASIDKEQMAAKKPQVLKIFDAVDAAIGRIGKAKTKKELKMAAGAEMFPLMMMMGTLKNSPAPKGGGNPPEFNAPQKKKVIPKTKKPEFEVIEK